MKLNASAADIHNFAIARRDWCCLLRPMLVVTGVAYYSLQLRTLATSW